MLFSTILSSLGFPSAAVSSLETKQQCMQWSCSVLTVALPRAAPKLLNRKEDENTLDPLLKLSPAHLSALLCGPSPPRLLPIPSSDTSHQGMSPQGHGAQEGQDTEQGSNGPTLSAQQFTSPRPRSGTWRATAWVSLGEMPGCSWGARPGGLGTCSHHIGESL